MHCFGERQRTPPTQTADATHTDCERHPIRLRPPSDQIANGKRRPKQTFYLTKVDALNALST